MYGEVEYDPFLKILQRVRPRGTPVGGLFYDLGSGSGRPVFIAGLHFDFDACIGVEMLGGLHEEAKAVQKDYEQRYYSMLHPDGKYARIQFVHMDIMEFDWSDGGKCAFNMADR